MIKLIDPSVAEKLNKDRYGDDIATGGSAEEVKQMAGNCVGGISKFETDGTLSQILAQGSLRLKAVVTSGEQDLEKIMKLGKFVLGIGWNPTIDFIIIDTRQSDLLRDILTTNNVSLVILTLRILRINISQSFSTQAWRTRRSSETRYR